MSSRCCAWRSAGGWRQPCERRARHRRPSAHILRPSQMAHGGCRSAHRPAVRRAGSHLPSRHRTEHPFRPLDVRANPHYTLADRPLGACRDPHQPAHRVDGTQRADGIRQRHPTNRRRGVERPDHEMADDSASAFSRRSARRPVRPVTRARRPLHPDRRVRRTIPVTPHARREARRRAGALSGDRGCGRRPVRGVQRPAVRHDVRAGRHPPQLLPGHPHGRDRRLPDR